MASAFAPSPLDRLPADDASPDALLVARVLAGERRQFAVLVRRHNQKMFRAVRAVLRDDAEAEDVVQQAWVHAFHALAQFRGDAGLGAWLARIAVNEALGRVRTRTRRGDLSLVETGEDVAVEPRTPEDDASARETARIIERHIDALPEIYRVVFVLRDVEELSTGDTAAALGVSDETVRVRLHRARQTLQAALADSLGLAVAGAFHFDGARCDAIVLGVMTRLGLL